MVNNISALGLRFRRRVIKKIHKFKYHHIQETWPQVDVHEKRFLINHDYHFIYCPIPKAACSSFKELMLKLEGKSESDEGMVHARTLEYTLEIYPYEEALTLLKNNHYFKFTIVRNPWIRLVSGYLDKFVFYKTLDLSNFTKDVIDWVYQDQGQKADYQKSITFEQFVKYLCSNPDRVLNSHWKPQYLFLGNTDFDFIGRFESLVDDYQTIQAKTGIPLELQWRNKTIKASQPIEQTLNLSNLYPSEIKSLNSRPSYHQLYTPKLVEDIRQRYQQDVERFAYDFNAENLR